MGSNGKKSISRTGVVLMKLEVYIFVIFSVTSTNKFILRTRCGDSSEFHSPPLSKMINVWGM